MEGRYGQRAVPQNDKSARIFRCRSMRAFSQFRCAVRSETFLAALISANENRQENFKTAIGHETGFDCFRVESSLLLLKEN
jgi:hypothetical protein